MRLILRELNGKVLESYKITDEQGEAVFYVEGKWHLTREFILRDKQHRELYRVKKAFLSVFPKYHIYERGQRIGSFRMKAGYPPKYNLDFNGWYIKGSRMGFENYIFDQDKELVAETKRLRWRAVDTFSIDVENPENAALAVLCMVCLDYSYTDIRINSELSKNGSGATTANTIKNTIGVNGMGYHKETPFFSGRNNASGNQGNSVNQNNSWGGANQNNRWGGATQNNAWGGTNTPNGSSGVSQNRSRSRTNNANGRNNRM